MISRHAMNCLSILKQRAGESITRPALVGVDSGGRVVRHTWRDLFAQVLVTIRRIDRQGFSVGDRVVHSFGNTCSGVIVALASLVKGTIEVPLDPKATLQEREALLRLVDGRLLEGEGEFDQPEECVDVSPSNAWVSELITQESGLSPDHAALILFTSGSTGKPRGVLLSRGNLFSNAQGKLAAVPQTREDVRLTVLPLWHAYARTCDLMTWLITGGTLAIGQGWDGWETLATEVTPTLINTVPSLASRLRDEAFDTPATRSLRLLGCGGAAMTTELFDDYRQAGITVIQGYGLTEASPVVCSASPWNARAGVVGLPVMGCQSRINDAGCLEVAGTGVMIGYWQDDEATASKICAGWLQTGDCAEVDPFDGQYRILGRSDDRITLSNGLKFFPGPIEQRLGLHPSIRHAILLPHDRHVTLYLEVSDAVEFDSAISGQALLADVERMLNAFPAWQRPREVHLLSRPISDIAGALTAKGTLCRPIVLKALSNLRP